MSNSSSDESDCDNEEEFISNIKQASEWLTEEEDSAPTGPPRTKNELAFDDSLIYDPDAEDAHHGEAGSGAPENTNAAGLGFEADAIRSAVADELSDVGTIMCRMDEEHTLVVQASYTESPLNEGSLLFFREGVVLGRVCEIFGPITTPFYVVRWAALPVGKSNKTSTSENKKSKNKKNNKKDKSAEKDTAVVAMEVRGEDEVETTAASDIAAGAGAEVPSIGSEEMCVDDEDAADAAISVGDGAVAAATDGTVADITGDTSTDAPVPIEVSAEVSIEVSIEVSQEVGVSAAKDNSSSVSAAQLEHFTLLMSRALPGTAVYSTSKHNVVITASSLTAIRKQNKGTDASNLYDEEIADDEQEYSDDEEELLAKQERNRAKRTFGSSGDKDNKSVHPADSGTDQIPPGPRALAAGRGKGDSRAGGLKAQPSAVPRQQQPFTSYNNQNPNHFQGHAQQQQQQQEGFYRQHHQGNNFPPNPNQFEGNRGHPNYDQNGYPNGNPYPYQQQQPFNAYPPQPLGFAPQLGFAHHDPNMQGGGGQYNSNNMWQQEYQAPGNQQMLQYQQQQQQQQQRQQPQQQQQQQQQPQGPYHFPTHIQQPQQRAPSGGQAPSLPWAGFEGSGSSSAPMQTPPGAPTGAPVYTYQPIQYDQKK